MRFTSQHGYWWKRGLLMMFSLIRSLLLHHLMIDLLMRRIWLESFAIKKGTKPNLILWIIWDLLFQSTHSNLGFKILGIPYGILRCRGRLQVMWLLKIEFNALKNVKLSRIDYFEIMINVPLLCYNCQVALTSKKILRRIDAWFLDVTLSNWGNEA